MGRIELPMTPAQGQNSEHLAEGGGQASLVDPLPTPEKPALTLS